MLVGSPEEEEKEEDDEHDGSNEDIFKPKIVCVHSHSRDDTTDTCSRCFSEPLQNITHNHNHMHINSSRTDYDETLSETERDSLSDDEEEIEKENEKIEGIDSEKYDDLTHDDLNSKLRLIFHLDGLKETGGLLYIGCECDNEKTNPSKIIEWFSAEFLNLHRVYAIREEEPFLLKVFTRNHEVTNRGIRKKGGRKVILMGKEVFGDVLLACGHCGYWSREGSNVRRHLKKSVCLKERGYCKEELAGLDRLERRRFLRRVAAAKCRAKKKARALSEGGDRKLGEEDTTPLRTITTSAATATVNTSTTTSTTATTTTTTTTDILTGTSTTTTTGADYSSCPFMPSEGIYAECLVEIDENCYTGDDGKGAGIPALPKQQKVKKRVVRNKAPLMLGPVITQETVLRAPYDIFTINENNDRVAWKPPHCHKIVSGNPCQIVFKGARLKRRCLDVPVPRVLIYRKLDCKTHHCNFTLFHPNARSAFHCDKNAKASVDIKMYGEMVMTQEFYHYFVSLLSIMKMKASQTARHLTSVWETILRERLGTSTIPEEYHKIITLNKQTVKSLWSSIEEETGNRKGVRLSKESRRRKKPPPPSVMPSSISLPPPLPLPPSSVGPFSSAMDACGVAQPPSVYPCMKRLNPIAPKPPPLPPPPTHPLPPTHGPPGPPKSSMMPLPLPHPTPPHPSHHNSMQQAVPHTMNHTHWLGQAPQYPHNMTPYPMAPHPHSTEYYPVPSHFMTQYTQATMGTSP